MTKKQKSLEHVADGIFLANGNTELILSDDENIISLEVLKKEPKKVVAEPSQETIFKDEAEPPILIIKPHNKGVGFGWSEESLSKIKHIIS